MTDDILTDGARVEVEFEPVRARGTTRTLETEVVRNGFTPDDDGGETLYLAEYHSENDRYPRRRVVETDDGPVVQARRTTEDGARWAAFSTPGATVSVLPAEEADEDDDESDADAEPVAA